MKRSLYLLAGLAVAATTTLSTPVYATDVPFAGAVLGTCLPALGTAGVLHQSSDATALSSKNSLGVPAVITLTTTSDSFEATVTPPSDWDTTTATGTVPATTFTVDYQRVVLADTLTGSITAATQIPLLTGANVMTLNLTGQSTGSAFGNGAYTAIVTVTCEATSTTVDS